MGSQQSSTSTSTPTTNVVGADNTQSTPSNGQVGGVKRYRKPYVDDPLAGVTKEFRASCAGTTELVTPPAVIDLATFLAKDPETCSLYVEEMKKRSYACFKTDEATKGLSQQLTASALEYLALPSEVKYQNKEAPTPINNVGFIDIPNVREYIKLYPSSPAQLWPTHPPTFKDHFQQFHSKYTTIATTAFQELASWMDDEPPSQRFIREDDEKTILEVLEARSSLSMIKYYPLTEAKEVCDEHTDTGILTLITRTSRPSLEIWDRSENKYIQVEQLLSEGDIVIFISEKVPLFSSTLRIPAAYHRVKMEHGDCRLSIAYLLDVAFVK